MDDLKVLSDFFDYWERF